MQFFNIKKLFSDTKKVVVIVSCALLLIGNILVFAYVGSATLMPAFFVVILSNIITILITFAIYKPINRIIEEEVQTRINDETNVQMKLLAEKNELEQQKKFLEDVAAQREQEIKKLQSELDTAQQYKSISNNANTVLKLETMEYEKKGYFVKEEYVRDTDLGRDIKSDSKWNPMKDDKGDQKILYIKKFHEKAIIGIDIAKIRFCKHDGLIFLEGVKVENLHQEMTVRNGDGDGMERCMILNVDNGDIKGINNADKYNWFKQEYRIRQNDRLDFEFEQEVRSICASYTEVIKNNLSSKFPSVRFVDDNIEHAIDLKGEPVYQLNASSDMNMLEVSSSIVLIANTIYQTMPVVERH